MPDIIGSVQELNAEEEMLFESQQLDGPSFLLQALKKAPESGEQIFTPKFVAPISFYGQAVLKSKSKGPLLALHLYSSIKSRLMSFCRHDASAVDAVVMKSPTKEHAKKYNKKYSLFT